MEMHQQFAVMSETIKHTASKEDVAHLSGKVDNSASKEDVAKLSGEVVEAKVLAANAATKEDLTKTKLSIILSVGGIVITAAATVFFRDFFPHLIGK